MDASFLVVNFRSILSKQDNVNNLIAVCNPCVILGTETWLSRDIDNNALFINKDYTIYRKDRNQSRGGGVLVAIKNCFSTTPILFDTDIEIVFVRVKFTFSYAKIGACYRPPDEHVSFNDEMSKALDYVTLQFPQCPVFLGGDFNFPGID